MPQRKVLMTAARKKLLEKGRMVHWSDYSHDGGHLGEVRSPARPGARSGPVRARGSWTRRPPAGRRSAQGVRARRGLLRTRGARRRAAPRGR